MPFEYAVRPFQSRDSFGRIILPSTPSGAAERATLTWGSSASLPPGTLPTPTTMGVNMKCCNETLTEDTRTGDTHRIEAENDPDSYIMVHRATEVKLQKKEENTCDDWYRKNSYVAAGVKESFVGLADAIHASDKEFLPAGAAAACRQTMKLNPNTTEPNPAAA
jgi:hypothetical protein